MSRLMRFLLVVLAALSPLGNAFAEPDKAGCSDHPLFTRMPNMHIHDCKISQFDLRSFPVGAPDAQKRLKSVDVEGPTQWIHYILNKDVTANATAKPSALQIQRNFQNAAKKAGGTIEGQYVSASDGHATNNATYEVAHMPQMTYRNGSNQSGRFGYVYYSLTMKFVKNGKDTWAFVQPSDIAEELGYRLTITERQEMQQDVVANDLLDEINKHGFVAVYFNFDTGKATLQPDAVSQLDQIAQMLKASAALKLEVAGHTDNVGQPEENQKLSEARAQTVVQELVKRSTAADRLTARGYGQGSPMADNRAEEGRAKNRRVELVKK
jgi:outer membrane protein OmpA-like peptidoglycan-associated protein